MKYLIFIVLFLGAFKGNAQEEEYNKKPNAQEVEYKNKPTIMNRALKNLSFEVIGMRSIVLQKEPYPFVPFSPTSSNLSGYIPVPSYSFQFGILKETKIHNSIYLKYGINCKYLNKKFQRTDSWVPILPGLNNSFYVYQKSYFLVLSNYILYRVEKTDVGFGINAFKFYIKNPEVITAFSFLARIERNILKMRDSKELHFILELEGSGKKWNYYQFKLGLNYKI